MKRKRMRLPNGFGQITELKNKRLRNPFRVMVTVGKTEEGKPICKLLKPVSYFATYNDAYKALVDYNANPYDLDSDITMDELYEKWLPTYEARVVDSSSIVTVKNTWKYCSKLHKYRVKELRAYHVKECLEEIPKPNLKIRTKSTINMMLDYAVEHDLVDRNVSRSFKLSKEVNDQIEKEKTSHKSFTNEEMSILLSNLDKTQFLDMIIYQCFSGWRPAEMLEITLDNINLENMYVIGGKKTNAGKKRIVPIHPLVQPIVRKYYELAKIKESDRLFSNDKGKPISYDIYYYRFGTELEKLNILDHRPHDPRKQFITMAKKYNVDEFAIKRIVGHIISDITESLYTDRDTNWLSEEITKIQANDYL